MKDEASKELPPPWDTLLISTLIRLHADR